MILKEIYEDMEQILAEDYTFYATVLMCAAEFMWRRSSKEDDSWSSGPKTSTTDKQVEVIPCMV